MKKLLILFITLLSGSTGYQSAFSQVTQEWTKIFGYGNYGGRNHNIAVDNLGNVYVADSITIKYNSAGEILWFQDFRGSSIAVDTSYSVYVTGFGETVKYDSYGFQVWYSPEIANSQVKVDGLGNAYTYSPSFITKYNSLGYPSYFQPTGTVCDIDFDTAGHVYSAGYEQGSSFPNFMIIKYNLLGERQWVRQSSLFENSFFASLEVDDSANVFVTGMIEQVLTTKKYNKNGTLKWTSQSFYEFSNTLQYPPVLKLDDLGNVYVVASVNTQTTTDYAIIKYNSAGQELWFQQYSPQKNAGVAIPISITSDLGGNVYVTGGVFYETYTDFEDMVTVKFNACGTKIWDQIFTDHTTSQWFDQPNSIIVDPSRNVYVSGAYNPGIIDFIAIKYSQPQIIDSTSISYPAPYGKLISGETDTIRWTPSLVVEDCVPITIKCILNEGTLIQSEITIAKNIPNPNGKFGWKIPDDLLSYRSKLIIQNANDTINHMVSKIFRIKPYLLTRVNDDSTYYGFRKDMDQWGFEDKRADMFPSEWYNQPNHFDYKGIDPFTNLQYSQEQGRRVFKKAKSSDYPDWISFVMGYNREAYLNIALGTYSDDALMEWKSGKGKWESSSVGIATTNAIIFRKKSNFQSKYNTFPAFENPIEVESHPNIHDTVKKVINEFRERSWYLGHNWNYTTNKTLNEIKTMLLSEDDPVKTLYVYGRELNVYKVKRDDDHPAIFKVYVYDNKYPNSNVPILIDTARDDFGGEWFYQYTSFPQWRNDFLAISNPAINILPGDESSNIINSKQSPFSDSILQIFNPVNSSIIIRDIHDDTTGFFNNIIYHNIYGSIPLNVRDSIGVAPGGYELPAGNYSLKMSNFSEDTVETYFFTGNKSFSYDRGEATNTQTDMLFFNGGVSISNPDAQTKTINLSNIIEETTQEKVFYVSSIEMIQNDSVKIENPDDDKFKFTSYGSAKHYDLEISHPSTTGLERFTDFKINLPANTSHTLVPNWSNIAGNDLIILEDIGNNGTIDDTIRLEPAKILNIKVLIEGFYNSSTKIMVGDTVGIYIRNVSSPFTIIDSAKVVLDSYGDGSFNSNNVVNGIPYYIAIKHRNSIETWSASGQNFTNNSLSYDFSTALTQAYGNNMKQVDASPLRFGIYSGDVNQNGSIDVIDLGLVDNDAFNFVTGYVSTDVTGNNVVDVNDLAVIDNNAFNFVGKITPP